MAEEINPIVRPVIDRLEKLERMIQDRPEPTLPASAKPPINYITREAACQLLGVCDTTLWNWENKGVLIPYKLEGTNKIYYRPEDIEAKMESTRNKRSKA